MRFAVLALLLAGCGCSAAPVQSREPAEMTFAIAPEAEAWRPFVARAVAEWATATGRAARVVDAGEPGSIPVTVDPHDGRAAGHGGPAGFAFAHDVSPNSAVAFHEVGHAFGAPDLDGDAGVMCWYVRTKRAALAAPGDEIADLGIRQVPGDYRVMQALWAPTCIDERSAASVGGVSTCDAGFVPPACAPRR